MAKRVLRMHDCTCRLGSSQAFAEVCAHCERDSCIVFNCVHARSVNQYRLCCCVAATDHDTGDTFVTIIILEGYLEGSSDEVRVPAVRREVAGFFASKSPYQDVCWKSRDSKTVQASRCMQNNSSINDTELTPCLHLLLTANRVRESI